VSFFSENFSCVIQKARFGELFISIIDQTTAALSRFEIGTRPGRERVIAAGSRSCPLCIGLKLVLGGKGGVGKSNLHKPASAKAEALTGMLNDPCTYGVQIKANF
jgi:hypothetical protein